MTTNEMRAPIIANIHAPVLIDLDPRLVALVRDDGALVVSGCPRAQVWTVVAAMHPLRPVHQAELDDWVVIELRRP